MACCVFCLDGRNLSFIQNSFAAPYWLFISKDASNADLTVDFKLGSKAKYKLTIIVIITVYWWRTKITKKIKILNFFLRLFWMCAGHLSRMCSFLFLLSPPSANFLDVIFFPLKYTINCIIHSAQQVSLVFDLFFSSPWRKLP